MRLPRIIGIHPIGSGGLEWLDRLAPKKISAAPAITINKPTSLIPFGTLSRRPGKVRVGVIPGDGGAVGVFPQN